MVTVVDHLKPVRAWRVYYSPDSWVCSTNGIEPEHLEDGVQVVLTWETKDCDPGIPYARRLSGSDWYFWASTEIGLFCGTLSDFVTPGTHGYPPGRWLSPEPILEQFPNAVLKQGTWIDDEIYERTYELACEVTLPWPSR